jgi:ribosomal protein S1
MKEITEKQYRYLSLIVKHQGESRWAWVVSKKLDVQENTVRVQLSRLVKSGFLKKIAPDQYAQAIPDSELEVLSMSYFAHQKQVKEKKEAKKEEMIEKVKEVKSRKSETIRISSYRIVTPSTLLPLEYQDGKLSKIPIPLYLSA